MLAYIFPKIGEQTIGRVLGMSNGNMEMAASKLVDINNGIISFNDMILIQYWYKAFNPIFHSNRSDIIGF